MQIINEMELMQKQPKQAAVSHWRRDPVERNRWFQAREDRLRRSAEAMKELRYELDVSMAELARKTGVSDSIIWNVEHADGLFSAAQLKRILVAYPKHGTAILEIVGKHLPELVEKINPEKGR